MVLLLKALADSNRMRVVAALLSRPACAKEIALALGLRQSNLSRHLKVLCNAGLISGSRHGNKISYTSTPTVENADLLNIIDQLAVSDVQFQADLLALNELVKI